MLWRLTLADDDVVAEPEKYYDQVIDINLSDIEPSLNGPFTPDAYTPISKMGQKMREFGYPQPGGSGAGGLMYQLVV